MDTPGLAEMEQGRMGENQTHELTDLSPVALHRRIAALEQNQKSLQELIATLEQNVEQNSFHRCLPISTSVELKDIRTGSQGAPTDTRNPSRSGSHLAVSGSSEG
jgi:hypothetical protein